jgi:hypothetical protein
MRTVPINTLREDNATVAFWSQNGTKIKVPSPQHRTYDARLFSSPQQRDRPRMRSLPDFGQLRLPNDGLGVNYDHFNIVAIGCQSEIVNGAQTVHTGRLPKRSGHKRGGRAAKSYDNMFFSSGLIPREERLELRVPQIKILHNQGSRE